MSSLSVHGPSSPELFQCERALFKWVFFGGVVVLLTDDRKGPRLFFKEKPSPEQPCHVQPLLPTSPGPAIHTEYLMVSMLVYPPPS